MNCSFRNHLLLLNIIFTCGFLVHVFTIGSNLMHPEYPSIRVYSKDLNQISFPLTFKLCVTEQENFTERYTKMGYADEHSFFTGKSIFDEELIGWGGHSRNGSSLHHVLGLGVHILSKVNLLLIDVLSNVSFNWKDILRQVDLWTMDRTKFTVTGTDIKWSLLPSGYPTCQAVDLTQYFDLKKVTPMFFVFKFFPRENLGLSLHIEDRETSLLKRGLRSQRHDYLGFGSAIKIDSLASGVYKRFHLKISQTINLEIDSGIKCRKYPNIEFQSYRNCDEDFVYKKMKYTFQAMPFWAAKTFEEVTNRT